MKNSTKTDILMKTSNKLLIGLVVAFFLVITLYIILAKQHLDAKATFSTSEQKEETSLNFYEQKADAGRLLYFPIAVLQHPLLKVD